MSWGARTPICPSKSKTATPTYSSRLVAIADAAGVTGPTALVLRLLRLLRMQRLTRVRPWKIDHLWPVWAGRRPAAAGRACS